MKPLQALNVIETICGPPAQCTFSAERPSPSSRKSHVPDPALMVWMERTQPSGFGGNSDPTMRTPHPSATVTNAEVDPWLMPEQTETALDLLLRCLGKRSFLSAGIAKLAACTPRAAGSHLATTGGEPAREDIWHKGEQSQGWTDTDSWWHHTSIGIQPHLKRELLGCLLYEQTKSLLLLSKSVISWILRMLYLERKTTHVQIYSLEKWSVRIFC